MLRPGVCWERRAPVRGLRTSLGPRPLPHQETNEPTQLCWAHRPRGNVFPWFRLNEWLCCAQAVPGQLSGTRTASCIPKSEDAVGPSAAVKAGAQRPNPCWPHPLPGAALLAAPIAGGPPAGHEGLMPAAEADPLSLFYGSKALFHRALDHVVFSSVIPTPRRSGAVFGFLVLVAGIVVILAVSST